MAYENLRLEFEDSLAILTIDAVEDGFDLAWSSVPGKTYQVEHLPELAEQWNVVTTVPSAGSATSFQDREQGRTGAPTGHYRVRVVAPAAQ